MLRGLLHPVVISSQVLFFAVKVQGSKMMNMEAIILDLSSNSLDLLLMRGLVLFKSQQHLLNVDQGTLNHDCA